ncbi:MAG TPA: histidine kinase [Verrucomicrobiae bacterium]|jgi:signal transduction histidine kinase
MINSSLDQYRALLARQQSLYQQQHKRLSRRVHDDISQHLTLLSLQLSLALSDAKPPANWSQMCQQWSNLVQEMGQNLRSIINEIQPRIIDDLGLGAALQWYVNSSPSGVQCQLLLPRQPASLAPVAANELFAICRDIVSDLLAPNGIKQAVIELEQSHDQLRLHVRVGGKHPDLAPLVSKTLDALSIHERLFCVDGGIDVNEHAANGLAITLSIPATTRHAVSHAA